MECVGRVSSFLLVATNFALLLENVIGLAIVVHHRRKRESSTAVLRDQGE